MCFARLQGFLTGIDRCANTLGMGSGSGVRVLGIDPGSRILGFGVVERQGNRLIHVSHGFLRFHPQAALAQRLGSIYASIAEVLAEHRPDAVAVEGLFTFRSPRSALTLAQARGAALACVANQGL